MAAVLVDCDGTRLVIGATGRPPILLTANRQAWNARAALAGLDTVDAHIQPVIASAAQWRRRCA